METKSNLLSKYKGKILGKCCYKNGKDYFAKELSSSSTLLFFLYSVFTHEYRITNDGLNFLKEFYGLDKLYKMICKEQKEGIDYSFTNKIEFNKWLQGKPYKNITEEVIKLDNNIIFYKINL